MTVLLVVERACFYPKHGFFFKPNFQTGLRKKSTYLPKLPLTHLSMAVLSLCLLGPFAEVYKAEDIVVANS